MRRRPAPEGSRCATTSATRRPACGDCLRWEFKLLVTLNTGTYLAIRLDEVELRARVVEHLAVGWWHGCQVGGHPGGFAGFFCRYTQDVERDADPTASDRDWDLHRVWTNHASLLHGKTTGNYVSDE
jgi:hypothetical protein